MNEGQSGPRLQLDRYLPFGLTAIANKIARSASRSYLQHYGVGINEWRVLANVRVQPQFTANQICQVSGLDKAAVSRSIKLLEAEGMLEVGSPDSRSRGLRLTPKGDALHDRMIKEALDREEQLLTGFSEEERELLHGFITRLHANVPRVNELTPPEADAAD